MISMRSSLKQKCCHAVSKSYCPFCKKTKSLFGGLGVDYHVDELDQMDDGQAIQQVF